jgi:hypothetical protein
MVHRGLAVFATLAGLLFTALPAAQAQIVNVEFKFTPYVGDTKDDKVTTVAGTARVFINNVPVAEQQVRAQAVPVMFAEREIAPSVWVPMASMGSVVRQGKNTMRIEFTPADPKLAYRAQLRWASVGTEVKRTERPGGGSATNQKNEGVEELRGPGPLRFERAFDAPFATARAWHANAPITALKDDEREQIMKLVQARTDVFKPDFAGFYKLLDASGQISADKVRQAGCLAKGYAAGVRMAVAPPAEVDLQTTGGPEVVVSARKGELYRPADPKAFERLKNEDMMMCVGMSLQSVYPARVIVVRAAGGGWEVVQ